MKTKAINHVTLLVKNKEVAGKFFTDVLGFEKYDAGGPLWIKIGEQFIHITDNSGEPRGNTFYHFAIEIEDIVEFARMIIDKGVKIFDLDNDQKEVLVNFDEVDPQKHFFIRDTDENLIEFVDSNNKFFNPKEV